MEGDRRDIGVSLLLFVITLGIYFPFWLYRTVKDLKNNFEDDIPYTPGKAVGFLFIPIFNIFWAFYILFSLPLRIKQIENKYYGENVGFYFHPLLISILLIVFIIISNLQIRLEFDKSTYGSILFFESAIFVLLLTIQAKLNSFFDFRVDLKTVSISEKSYPDEVQESVIKGLSTQPSYYLFMTPQKERRVFRFIWVFTGISIFSILIFLIIGFHLWELTSYLWEPFFWLYWLRGINFLVLILAISLIAFKIERLLVEKHFRKIRKKISRDIIDDKLNIDDLEVKNYKSSFLIYIPRGKPKNGQRIIDNRNFISGLTILAVLSFMFSGVYLIKYIYLLTLMALK